MSNQSQTSVLTQRRRWRPVTKVDEARLLQDATPSDPIATLERGPVPDPTVTDYGSTIAFRNDRVTIVYFGLFVGFGALLAMLHSAFYLAAHAVARPLVYVVLLGAVAVGASFTSFALTRLLDIRSWLGGDKTFVRWARTITFSLWGGLQGGFSQSMLVAGLFGIAPLALLDAVVLGLPLAQAIGRMGCLNYGCCYGRRCSGSPRFAIRYRNPTTKAMRYEPHLAGIALHPAPIYSSMANVAIYGTLLSIWLTQGERPAGLLAAIYMTLYGIKRFSMEFIRSDFPRPHALRLTMWHFHSATLATVGIVLLVAVVPNQAAVGPMDIGAGLSAVSVGWPLALIAALIMTAVYSIHGKEVGSW